MNTRFTTGGDWRSALMAITTGGLCLGMSCLQAPSASASSAAVFGVFVGSSPCGKEIRPLLGIPAEAKADLMQWKLTLHQDAKSLAPAGYELHCDYGLVLPNKPGLGKGIKTLDKRGTWTITKGTQSVADAVVLELDKSVSFVQVDRNILHVL